ncbi:MAG: hypothetical protein JKY65_27990 [Planctomycetes bacterium]|nr:hypothetical protein [Planctomycetota bacterium]
MPQALPRCVAATATALAFVFVLTLFGVPQSTAAPPETPGKYMGTSQCTKCHEKGMGGRAADALPALKEYPVWAKKDRHAFAFRRLQDKKAPNPRWRSKVSSEEIMEALYGGGDEGDDDDDDDDDDEIPEASKSARCLSCHGIMVAKLGKPAWLPKGSERRVSENRKLQQGYKASEGVSCDGCHGPASGWLEGHTPEHWATKEWKARVDPAKPYAASRRLWEEKGLYYSKDLVLWARQCVRCHLRLDADLIEAQHPPLKAFELFDQNSRVPAHWRDYSKATDAPELPGAGPTHTARLWQVGQAVALEDALKQVQSRTKKRKKRKVSKKLVKAGIARAKSHYTVLRHAIAVQPTLAEGATALKTAMAALGKAKKRKAQYSAAKKALKALKAMPYALATLKVDKAMVAKIEAAIKADPATKKGDAAKIAKLSLIPLGKAK